MAKRKKSGSKPSEAWKHVIGDAVVTILWVLASAHIGEIAAYLDGRFPELGGEFSISIALLLVFLLAFSPVCSFFWGGIFNPVNNAALIISGKGPLMINVLRMCSQVGSALVGSYAATKLVPEAYKGKFHANAGGLKSGAALEQGFMCEVGLGLAASLLFLLSLDMKNKQVAFWLPLIATALWCYVGSYYTGPSMNPSMAFSWNWHYQTHTPQEHFIVFWLGPFLGAGLAGLAYLGLSSGAAPASKVPRKGTRSSPRVSKAAGSVSKGETDHGASNGVMANGETDKPAAAAKAAAGATGVRKRVGAKAVQEVAPPAPAEKKKAGKKGAA